MCESSLVRVMMLSIASATLGCGAPSGHASGTPPGALAGAVSQRDYQIVNTYPHDPLAYTQGLVFIEGMLLEGTGLSDSSYLREVDLTTGTVRRQIKLTGDYFGEGIAVVGNRVYQLTWQHNRGFFYELATFRKLGEWEYNHEGWGLAYDGTNLILSDGTGMLRFLNPGTLAVVRTVNVTDAVSGYAVDNINELEMVKGELLANIYETDSIVRIDPVSGKVKQWINMAGLLSDSDRSRYEVDVLNGIAYDAATDRLFVTGKWWPKLFEVKLRGVAGGR